MKRDPIAVFAALLAAFGFIIAASLVALIRMS
jgi:hypothetical protein